MSGASLVDVGLIVKALGVVSSYDFEGAIRAFEGQDPEVKVQEGLMTADDALQIAGLFVPEAAMADEYVRLAELLVPVLWPLIMTAISKLPPPARPGPDEYEAWGHIFKR